MSLYYGVICPVHGEVELSIGHYRLEMACPNERWRCPICGGIAEWDDERHDASFEQFVPEEEGG